MALTADLVHPHDSAPRRAGTHRRRYGSGVLTAAGAALGAVVGVLAGLVTLAALLAAHLST